MLFSEQVQGIEDADWAAGWWQFKLYIFTQKGKIVTNTEEEK